MRVSQEQVRRFHEEILRDPVPEAPTLVTDAVTELRWKLINEELTEYREAASSGDLVGVADAIGDLLYVVLGTAVAHGIDARACFDEVHRSNMTKTAMDPVTRKGGKGPGYEPPRMAEVVFNMRYGA